MLLSTRAKPAHAEDDNLILHFFAEMAERFLLYCANINFTCEKIEPQPN